MPETKRALVIGAGSGIGYAIASKLADRTYQVTATWHRTPHPEDARMRWVQLDIGFERDRAEFWHGLQEIGEMPEILVFCPAILRDQSMLRLETATFTTVIDHNLGAAVDSVRAVSPAMSRDRWGRIVLIGSAVSQIGNPGQSAYSASKSAMVGLVRTVARELGPRNITVNLVEPGIIDTALVRDLSHNVVSNMAERTPLRRAGRADEVADVVAYLVSDLADPVTGAQVRVDGGVSVALAP